MASPTYAADLEPQTNLPFRAAVSRCYGRTTRYGPKTKLVLRVTDGDGYEPGDYEWLGPASIAEAFVALGLAEWRMRTREGVEEREPFLKGTCHVEILLRELKGEDGKKRSAYRITRLDTGAVVDTGQKGASAPPAPPAPSAPEPARASRRAPRPGSGGPGAPGADAPPFAEAEAPPLMPAPTLIERWVELGELYASCLFLSEHAQRRTMGPDAVLPEVVQAGAATLMIDAQKRGLSPYRGLLKDLRQALRAPEAPHA